MLKRTLRKRLSDDSERVTHEIKRKHQEILSRNDSLDVKSGVILGFIILVLVQIILSGEATTDFSKNIALLLPFVSSAEYWVNFAAFVTLLGGLAALIAATFIGATTIRLRTYYDVDIGDRFAEYRAGEIDSSRFDKSVSMTLLNCFEKNKQNYNKKVDGAKRTLLLFILGITLLIARFVVIVISRSFLS